MPPSDRETKSETPFGATAETKPTPRIDASTPLQFLPGVGPQRVELFQKLGIKRTVDLLFLFPRSYQDIAPYQNIIELTPGVRSTVVGQIVDMDSRYNFSGRGSFGILLALDGGGYVRCVWFNQMFRQESFRRGMRIAATGIPKAAGISFEMRHPEYVVLGSEETLPAPRPSPVYPLTEGLQQKHIIQAVNAALESLSPTIEEALSPEIRARATSFLGKARNSGQFRASSTQSLLPDLDVEPKKPEQELLSIRDALKKIHQPETLEEAQQARLRFIFQELLVYQLAIAARRHQLDHQRPAPQIESSALIHARILKRFPFVLTSDQLSAIEDVRRDMDRTIPMNRLVQGDVGSGKTVIAQYAMLNAVANKFQSALMVPTELLARQHFDRLSKQMANSQVMVELLVSSLSQREQNELRQRIAIGTVDVVVGTQSLLSDQIAFHSLGLVVIDEQHKFGVEQRAALRQSRTVPHYLVLSATPIPRSIAMTQFGELDVSILREKPPNRAPVHTYLGTASQEDKWWSFVRKHVEQGRQAYVVIPRVEEDLSQEALGAEQVHKRLATETLAGLRIELLHGRMDGDTKQAKLDAFTSGETQVLVSTTVVEVGIDVPNATIMTILDADRLGLAQLHQLRGRVSRGSTPGYVCVFPRKGAEDLENERLKILVSTEDGFQLAEEDMRLRGTGDLLGTKQVGAATLRIADLVRDADVLTVARSMAKELIAADPNLEMPEHAKLQKLVTRRHGATASLGDVG
jgi:ATP-dependent DNA helicase RecG